MKYCPAWSIHLGFHEAAALGFMWTWLCAVSLYDIDLISVMADENTGRSKRQVMRVMEEPTSNRHILTYHYEVHVSTSWWL